MNRWIKMSMMIIDDSILFLNRIEITIATNTHVDFNNSVGIGYDAQGVSRRL